MRGRSHRIGKIILKRRREDSDVFVCLDGQQRFTTTVLFLIAQRDVALSKGDEKLVHDIEKILFVKNDKNERTSRLTPSLADRDVLNHLLKGEVPNVDVPMVRGYKYFAKTILGSLHDFQLRDIFEHSLDLNFMYVEILTEIDFGQIFLWFQENSVAASKLGKTFLGFSCFFL